MNKSTVSNLVVGIVLGTGLMSSAFAGGKHAGGHGDAAPHWMAPEEAAAKPNPIKKEPESIERGAKIFAKNCASCHGEKAMGDGPAAVALDPKPTNLVAMAGGHPDGDFAWKIENGRGGMPAWKGILKENQIWDVVNFIQSLELPKKSDMDGMSGMDHGEMAHDHDKSDSHDSDDEKGKKMKQGEGHDDDHKDSHEHDDNHEHGDENNN